MCVYSSATRTSILPYLQMCFDTNISSTYRAKTKSIDLYQLQNRLGVLLLALPASHVRLAVYFFCGRPFPKLHAWGPVAGGAWFSNIIILGPPSSMGSD